MFFDQVNQNLIRLKQLRELEQWLKSERAIVLPLDGDGKAQDALDVKILENVRSEIRGLKILIQRAIQ